MQHGILFYLHSYHQGKEGNLNNIWVGASDNWCWINIYIFIVWFDLYFVQRIQYVCLTFKSSELKNHFIQLQFVLKDVSHKINLVTNSKIKISVIHLKITFCSTSVSFWNYGTLNDSVQIYNSKKHCWPLLLQCTHFN